MSKNNVKNNRSRNLDISSTNLDPWDVAIADAERKIQEAKALVRKLKGSILVFKDRRDSGEPFPGKKSEQTEAGA
jgi:hypothetical protein